MFMLFSLFELIGKTFLTLIALQTLLLKQLLLIRVQSGALKRMEG